MHWQLLKINTYDNYGRINVMNGVNMWIYMNRLNELNLISQLEASISPSVVDWYPLKTEKTAST